MSNPSPPQVPDRASLYNDPDYFECDDNGQHHAVTFKKVVETQQGVYPSVFFKTDEKGVVPKPLVSLKYKEDTDITLLVRQLKEHFGKATMDVDKVNIFLAKFIGTMSSSLSEDWTSFGVSIGTKGGTITPANLLTIKYGSEVLSGNAGEATEDDQFLVAYYVLMINRMSRVTNETHKENLSKRAAEVQKLIGGGQISFNSLAGFHPTIYLNKEYLKLCAAIDMFLTKFPKTRFSVLKLGTMSTRYKDCNALQSFFDIRETMGFKGTREFVAWIGNEKVLSDLVRISRSGEEYHETHSYFPYQVDMDIVPRSNYSSSMNPHLHLWVHSIGALFDHLRSKNSMAFNQDNFTELAYNAALCVLARTGSSQLTHLVSDDQSPRVDLKSLEPRRPTTGVGPSVLRVPDSSRAIDWMKYAAINHFQVFPAMERLLITAQSRLAGSRPGTVGHALEGKIPLWTSKRD